MNFWNKLKKPIIALAPMDDVTDAAFRFIIAKYSKYGGQDIDYTRQVSEQDGASLARGATAELVMFTEFVSVAGLCSSGREKLLPILWYTDYERPIVAQIFGSNPKQFYEAAQLLAELGFDGIDINMGCPENKIEKQDGGAALIQQPELAQRIIVETKRGAGGLPVSVKTRLGYNTITLDWLRAILEAEPATLTVHLRTRKELSAVPAHWDMMQDIVALRDKIYCKKKTRPLIIGNGDVQSVSEARDKCGQYGCDGVMLGRAVFGNPWLFESRGQGIPPSLNEKLRVMLEHAYLFEKLFTGIKGFDVMKKHLHSYVSGFDGAKELRMRLMACKNADEVAEIVPF